MAIFHAAAMRVDLRLEAVHSLKEKRHIVKSIISRLQRTYQVAAAEVGHQDLWQRSTVAVAAVANSAGQVERILHRVERDLRGDDRIEVLATSISFLEEPA
jgi:uncharacterized protein YlxP (DUF503 family)